MKLREVVSPTAQRWENGEVKLTVPEAAELWRRVGSVSMSEQAYRRRCQKGIIQALGIDVSRGPQHMTDLDSLIAYFDHEVAAMRTRLEVVKRERKAELARLRK